MGKKKNKSRGSSYKGSPAPNLRKKTPSRPPFNARVTTLQEMPMNQFNGFSLREEAAYTERHFHSTNLRHMEQIRFVSAGYMQPGELFKKHDPEQETEANDPNNFVVPHTHVEDEENDEDYEDVEEEGGQEEEEEEFENSGETQFFAPTATAPSQYPDLDGLDFHATATRLITSTTSTTVSGQGQNSVSSMAMSEKVTIAAKDIDQMLLRRSPSPAPSDSSSEEICFVPRNKRSQAIGRPATQGTPIPNDQANEKAPQPAAPSVLLTKSDEKQAQGSAQPQAPIQSQAPVQVSALPTPAAPKAPKAVKPLHPYINLFNVPAHQLSPPRATAPMQVDTALPGINVGEAAAPTPQAAPIEAPAPKDVHPDRTQLKPTAAEFVPKSVPPHAQYPYVESDQEAEEDAVMRDDMDDMAAEEAGTSRMKNLALDDSDDINMTGASPSEADGAVTPHALKFASADEEYLYRYENESAESELDGTIDQIVDRRIRNGDVQFLIQYEPIPGRLREKPNFWVSYSKLEGEDREMADEFARMRLEFGEFIDAGMKDRIKDAEERELDQQLEDAEAGSDGSESNRLVESEEDEDDEEDDEDDEEDDEDDDEEDDEQIDEDYELALRIAEEEAYGAAADAYAAGYDDDDYDYEDEEMLGYMSFGPNKKGAFPRASRLADAYDDFDIMDRGRPSIFAPRTKKGKKPLGLDFISDEEIKAKLSTQWETDRQKKKARKEERLKAKQAVKIGEPPTFEGSKRYKYKVDLWYQDVDDIDFAKELIEFMNSDMDLLLFPPVDAYKRRMLHQLSADLELASKSIGKGDNRAPTLRKIGKKRCLDITEIKATLSQRKYRTLFKNSKIVDSAQNDRLYKIRKAAMRQEKLARKGGRGGGGGSPGVHNRPGTVVGSDAPEISSENKGRKMLEKMGYKSGMGLGAEGNTGITRPIEAVVRGGRAGLG